MNVFSNQIPSGAPVIVVLVSQEGCPACEAYEPVFMRVAGNFSNRGLPVLHLDAASEEPEAIAFMNYHNVQHTPTVVVAVLGRGPLTKLEGEATQWETQILFNTAWQYHQRYQG